MEERDKSIQVMKQWNHGIMGNAEVRRRKAFSLMFQHSVIPTFQYLKEFE